jgi:hypothetical protein
MPPLAGGGCNFSTGRDFLSLSLLPACGLLPEMAHINTFLFVLDFKTVMVNWHKTPMNYPQQMTTRRMRK